MTAALETLAGLVQKNARKDGFKFLNIGDVQWKPFAEKFSKSEAELRKLPLLPVVFQEDPFAQLSFQTGAVKEILVSANQKQHLYETGGEEIAKTILVNVQENAELEFVYFQTGGEQSFSRLFFSLDKNARVRLTVVQKGIKKGQVRVHGECRGEGSEMLIHGLTIGEGQNRQDLWADVRHSVPHTQSNMIAWCVVNDQSHSVFNGTMTIEQTAPFTEAFQKNKNLILSDRATVDTFPKLFISNNEVKCAHGSSVSTLEPDQLLYLQTRGISRDQAEKILLKGFIRQAIEWIADVTTRQKLEVALFGRVSHNDALEYGGDDE